MAYSKLRRHNHLLFYVEHHDGLECDACDRTYGDAYSCGKCNFTVHVACKFVFMTHEIFEHPSHDGHSLKLLTTGAPDHTDPKCHICSKNTKRLLYHCSTCNLNLDIDCMVDAMCAGAHLNMPWHHHPLIMIDFHDHDLSCEVCRTSGGHCYFCPRCRLVVDKKCLSVFQSPEITHPFHARHPLKLLTGGVPDLTYPRCHICGADSVNLLYHCDMCKFHLHMGCAIRNALPHVISNLKVHEHTLTLMPRLISFVCDACGTKGDRSPCVCVQCDFMFFHQKCIHLPRVIHVNHHDHRVSFKYPLGPGEWRCGVCWEEIVWSYGAYSCSLCPNYAIHSLCATRDDVWDWKELDGVPEEVEDIEPFKRNDDNTITHFSHEHSLISLNRDNEESSLCGACVRPIGTYKLYKCSESDCSFILHDTCANLPKKKRHFLSPKPLTLSLQIQRYQDVCRACCQVVCEGLIYSTYLGIQNFDLICSSITVPFIHGSHDHHLLYLKLEHGIVKTCQGCDMDENGVVMGCMKCDYFLDFRFLGMMIIHSLYVMVMKRQAANIGVIYAREKQIQRLGSTLVKIAESLCIYFVWLGISGTPNQEERQETKLNCCPTIVLHGRFATFVIAVAQVSSLFWEENTDSSFALIIVSQRHILRKTPKLSSDVLHGH